MMAYSEIRKTCPLMGWPGSSEDREYEIHNSSNSDFNFSASQTYTAPQLLSCAAGIALADMHPIRSLIATAKNPILILFM